jgi:tetratricopeptide (TPR) repeat protein
MGGKKKKQKVHLHSSPEGVNVQVNRKKKESVKSGYLKYLLAVLAITAAIYFPFLDNAFTNFDDNVYVTQNSLVTGQTLTKMYDIITTQVAGNHHPVTIFSFLVNFRLSGLEPYSYHLVNLVLHLLDTLLVFLLVKMLFKGRIEIALITALLFGIHPMHVESVAWVSARKDLLYVFFFLIGLMTWLKYQETKKVIFYFGSLVLMFLSCASKPAAVVFPLMLFIFDYFRQRLFHWKVIVEKIPFFGVSVFFGMLTLEAQAASEAIGTFENFGFFHRLMLACYGLMMYLVKMIVPTNLSALHPYIDLSKGLPAIFYLSVVFVSALVVLIFFSLSKTRILAFTFLFYLISLVLVLQFMAVGQAIIAERYTYLAYIGPFILIGYGYRHLVMSNNRQLVGLKLPVQGILILYVVFLAYSTYERNRVWKNSETLWGDVIEKYPDNWYAYQGRANYYFENNEIEKSLADYYKVSTLEPAKADGFIGLGKVYRNTNQTPKALEAYNKAMRIDSFNSYAYNNRGNIYFDMEEYDLALADYKKSLSLKPNESTTYNNLGSIYVKKAAYTAALENYSRSLELDPLNANTYLNCSMVYIMTNQSDKAQKNFEQYFKLIQGKATKDAFYWNGVNHQKQKHFADAIASFSKAIELSPTGFYYLSRSEAWLASGHKENALNDALKAKEFGANVSEAYFNKLR